MSRFSPLLVLTLLLIGDVFLLSSVTQADEFDDHSVYWLQKGTEKEKPLTSLSMQDGLKLKLIGRRISAPCLVVRTDEDNWARALVTWGYRKNGDKQIPVVLVERFVTYRSDRSNLTVASGKDVMLFPGFGFNFDIGQVVPIGQGEDLVCGEAGTLSPGPAAKLFALNGSAVPAREASKYPDPNSHEGVLPTDFAGRWQVQIDGRWDGIWELEVDGRRVYGKFTSNETQSVYEISGKVAALPHNVKFDVGLANTSQSVDAFLWTRNKSAMAGVVTMADRKIGFYALRLADDDAEAASEKSRAASPDKAPAAAPEAKPTEPRKDGK